MGLCQAGVHEQARCRRPPGGPPEAQCKALAVWRSQEQARCRRRRRQLTQAPQASAGEVMASAILCVSLRSGCVSVRVCACLCGATSLSLRSDGIAAARLHGDCVSLHCGCVSLCSAPALRERALRLCLSALERLTDSVTPLNRSDALLKTPLVNASGWVAARFVSLPVRYAAQQPFNQILPCHLCLKYVTVILVTVDFFDGKKYTVYNLPIKKSTLRLGIVQHQGSSRP